MSKLVLRTNVSLVTTPSSGAGDDQLTRDPSSGDVGIIAGAFSLPENYIFVGNTSGEPQAVPMTGDISITSAGVTSIGSGVIVNTDINATAAIALTKLAALAPNLATVTNASGFITTTAVTSTELGYLSGSISNIQTQINSKQATITGGATTITASNLSANLALISNSSGKVAVSSVTSTELGYLSGVTSAVQTQINGKLSVTLVSPANGDLIYRNSGVYTNLPVGSDGEVLTVVSGIPTWSSGAINGIPIGGTTGQYLVKLSGTNYDAGWGTLTVSTISDLTATAAEINILQGVTGVTSTEINYLANVTSDIQTQLNTKLNDSLSYNSIWVGNASNQATQYAPGNEGEVLTIVSGAPQWQPFPLTGDAINGPGASTDNAIVRWNGIDGLSVQNSGIIIDDSNNVTGANLDDSVTKAGQYIYRAGGTDIPLGDGGTGASLSDPEYDGVFVWDDTLNETRIAAISGITYDSGTNTLTGSGGGGSAHVIEEHGTPLTDRANLNVTNGLTASDNDPDTDVKLGGLLTQNTTINGDAGTYALNITHLSTGSITNEAGYGLSIGSNSATITNGSGISFQANTSNLTFGDGTRLVRFTSSGVEFDFGSDATGDTYYRDASGFLVRNAIGTEGYVLTVSSGLPVWAAASAVYTNEDARDAVGGILTDTATVDFTYNDGADTITADVKDNSITDGKIRQSSGLSILGRSANSTGNIADITSTTDGYVLRQSSSALSFGLISGTSFSTQSANTFLGGPISGASATPTFRVLNPVDLPFPTTTQSGSTYTLLSTDHGYSIYFTNSGGCTVTLPSTLPTDFWVNIVRAEGAGTITFVAGGTSVLNTVNDETTIDFEHGAVSWEYKGSNDWYGWGTLGTSGGGGGSGTVTSVNLASITGFATASGGPITGSGTLTLTLDNQSANTVLIGPISGSASTPTFRVLDMLDTPRPAKTVSSSTYTVVDADLGYNIYFTNSTGCVVTLDSSITVSNFWFTAVRDKAMTSGSLTFFAGGSAILNTVNGELSISEENGAASWEYKGSNDWYGWGTLGTGAASSAHVIEAAGTPLTQRANLNFYNGLTASDNTPDTDVKWGGALTANTTITGGDTYSVSMTGLAGFTATSIGAVSLTSGAGSAITLTGDSTSFSVGASIQMNIGSDASGDMYYRGPTGIITRFSLGSPNTLLGVNNGGSNPEYKTVSNGLTAAAGTLKLGGALTANTSLTGNFGFGIGVTPTAKLHTKNNTSTQDVFIATTSGGVDFFKLSEIGGTPFIISTPSDFDITSATSTGSGSKIQVGTATSTDVITFAPASNSLTVQQSNSAGGTATMAFSNGAVQFLGTGSGTRNFTISGFSNTIVNLGSDANGDLYYRFGGVLTRLGIGTSGQVLTVSGGGLPSWTTAGGGSGTVTSVAATQPAAGFTISGSPITTSGTLTFALSDDLAALEALASTGFATRIGSNSWAQRTITAGTGIGVSNGTGVSGNPTISLSHLGIQNLSDPGADRIMFWDESGNIVQWLTVGSGLNITGTTITASAGSLDGGGAAGEVAYWADADTLTSETDFAYDASTNILSVEGIELGISSTAGTTRQIIPVGSQANIDLLLYPKVNGDVVLGTDSTGDIQLGRATAGGNRNIVVGSSSTDASMLFYSKGNGNYRFHDPDDIGDFITLAVDAGVATVSAAGANLLVSTDGGNITLDPLTGDLNLGLTGDKIGFLGATAIVQQASGGDLTNNVTSGGTTDTIANYTDLSTYANDAATIRNNIYQLARKVAQINNALRDYGLLD